MKIVKTKSGTKYFLDERQMTWRREALFDVNLDDLALGIEKDNPLANTGFLNAFPDIMVGKRMQIMERDVLGSDYVGPGPLSSPVVSIEESSESLTREEVFGIWSAAIPQPGDILHGASKP